VYTCFCKGMLQIRNDNTLYAIWTQKVRIYESLSVRIDVFHAKLLVYMLSTSKWGLCIWLYT